MGFWEAWLEMKWAWLKQMIDDLNTGVSGFGKQKRKRVSL
jgi:hypothetical protein